uniref:alpha-glucosidase n=1 Tax=Sparus aurata TaxID=8175 RepID=A0A671YCK1_SPAAU
MAVTTVTLIALFFTREPEASKEDPGITPEGFVPQCPNIPLSHRVDCFPDAGASKQQCEQRGCCWNPLDERNVPWCFFPVNHGYTAESVNKPRANGKCPSLCSATLTLPVSSPQISDAHKQRFEVPHEHIPVLTYQWVTCCFSLFFFVSCSSSSSYNTFRFDTTMAPLVFSDQYLQLSAKLPSHNIYGLGEHVHQNYRLDTNWRTWPIFTRDAFPNGVRNTRTHSSWFKKHSCTCTQRDCVYVNAYNVMEVVLQPAPAVTYRTIGGVLDFYILFGDTPEQVVQEFLELPWQSNCINNMPVIPPYWSLGFQLSRWNYGSLAEVKATVERNRATNMPYDIQYTDIDYMEDKKDFTYDKVKFSELPQFADYLHEKGQKYILILDPAVATSKRVGNTPYEAYDRGTAQKAWVFQSDGKTPLLGEVWPGETVFPDYTSQACIDWWVDEYERFYREIKHDALWIDMNEVANFKKGSINGCADNNLNYPPYTPRVLDEVLYSKTLCMDAKQAWGNHYDVHSLYGYSMVLATEHALQRVFGENRTLMLTRSSFPGVGKYSGHWLGDNGANWNDIKWAIPGMLEFGLFGVPYIGADICGFFDEPSEELCRRWMQVGAFYPFSRNHNAEGYKPQDPAAFGPDSLLVATSKHYLEIRYTLLPYLYTLFYKAHTTGETVVRPVMHEFFTDSNTWDVDRQFLWGKNLLITPVLDPVINRFCCLLDQMERLADRKKHVNMHLPADKLGLHIRGGAILPTQRPNVTTTYSRLNPMGLIIALDDNGQAAGELFWDDGDTRDSFFLFIFLRVLTLQGLGLALRETYVLAWDLDPVDEAYQRFDCYPEENSDEAKCKARGCIWQVRGDMDDSVPWCYFPTDYGYSVSNSQQTLSGMTVDINRNMRYRSSNRPGSPDINNLRVEIIYHKSDMLQFKIWDPTTERYEVPVELSVPATPDTDENSRLYKVQITQNPFGIQVYRKSTGTKIWDSSVPGFTFSDMFIQVSTRLASENIYGFGETEHPTYRHNLDFHTWGMFSKDQPPGYKMNCYGVHPFYMGLEDTTDAHGVLLLNSNAMDVTFQPTPALTYRTLGGILDFYMVLGPTPESVVQQYTELIGRPVLPAYWSLGFQLCRYGYVNDTEISDLYRDMKKAGIPYDVQYGDIDYMERQLDFVLSSDFSNLPALVDTMRGEGMRFIFILDPAISGNETQPYPAFERGVAADVFIKWPKELSDEIVWGKVWPDFPNVTVDESLDWDTQVELYRAFAAFPDFFRDTTAAWWRQEIKDFYDKTMKFDGLWIDMNEPASFVHGTVGGKCLGNPLLENPPYMPRKMHSILITLCMNSEQILPSGKRVKHYDVHNLYGWSHTKPTYDALLNVTGKRGIVVTRSTYPSSGKWAGHWLGDNFAAWDQLEKSIIADICGFFNPSEYELCLRWMQLGAFYPYSRNHNGKGNPRQDPVSWDERFANVSRDVLNIRYTLLPYLYTLMYEAHVKGSTVVRPLLHEFVDDKNTYGVHKQFLWGPAFLITPALAKVWTHTHTHTHTHFYIYTYISHCVFLSLFPHINLHIRGGYIIPWQKAEPNTFFSRKNPLGLIVALSDSNTTHSHTHT